MKKISITEKMINDFEQKMREDEKSEATIDKYLHDLHCFYIFADKKAIDKSLVVAYKSELGKHYALSSANSMIAALNSFLKFVGLCDCCVKQFKIQKKTFCPEEKELTKQEYICLVKTAEKKKNKRLSLLIQTICSTGIRVSEVEFITVEAIERGEVTVTCKSKTRSVFIVSDLRKKLLRYAKNKGISSGAIFVTKSGKPLNRSNIWHEMKSICKDAGVSPTKVFPHNLRHLFARVFYSMEKDVAKLADILGHSSINTTRIYIISTGAEHRRKIENMRLII